MQSYACPKAVELFIYFGCWALPVTNCRYLLRKINFWLGQIPKLSLALQKVMKKRMVTLLKRSGILIASKVGGRSNENFTDSCASQG